MAALLAVLCVRLLLLLPIPAAAQTDDDDVVVGPGKIGLIVETLSERQAAEAGDPALRGARVAAVTPGSPADKLGIAAGDVIVQANGQPVTSHADIASLLRDRWIGAATRLRIRRTAGQPAFEIVIPAAAQPILRIDAGMHNAPIRKLAADPRGRWLVTVSDDKTAKVWDLSDGRLLRSLRPPLGDDKEGKLDAVAISPDGASVAIAGWTGLWAQSASVYLFDRASGRLSRRLQGPAGLVEALAWSPDGSLLAASFGGTHGLRVYRTSHWASLCADAGQAAHTTALDFDRGNRLLAASQDGFLQIYLPDQEGCPLHARRLAVDGPRPAAVRYSPDGHWIALACAASTRVQLFAAQDLSAAYEADTQSVRNGDLRTVAWSADGRTLFAAGRYVAGHRHAVRSWSDAGRGPPSDQAVAANTIFDLQGLPGGGVAFATAEPAWGVLAADGTQRLGARSPIVDFRGGGGQLQVSGDGHRIRFVLDPGTGTAASYDGDNGVTIGAAPATPAEFAEPVTARPGLSVTGWKDAAQPRLNGSVLRLRPGENARSLAIAPNGESLVVGGDLGISKFDRNGKLLGRIDTPGAAWAVNLSADGRFIVGGFADGTIRWYGAGDGRERLALFVRSDAAHWVVWSPSGYYAASAAGEDLIGWHVNRGSDDAGDFFPAARFRARYFRPDVLAMVLDFDSDAEAFRHARQAAGPARPPDPIALALPPVIDPVSPVDDQFRSASVIIRFRVRNVDDAPLQGFRVRVNGGNVPQASLPAAVKDGAPGEGYVELRLPMRDSTVELFAENRNGVSVPAVFRFAWKGAAPAAPALPTLYVLAIGISNYRDGSISLGYPAKDAKDFVETLKLQQQRLYGAVRIVMLTNEQATRRAVLDNLGRIRNEVKDNDVGMLFIAGHGYNAKDGTYYFLPFDFDTQSMDSTGSVETAVVYSAIRDALAGMSGRAMLFIDTCHSGNVLGKSDLTGVINDLTARENNVVVFASSTRKELSQESDAWKNGVFTKALVAGLRGDADFLKDGKIMYTGLQFYLSRTVSALTGGAQHPVVLAPGGVEDFVVAIP